MAPSDSNWQQKLLPFMQMIIILLTVFYLAVSFYQFKSLSVKIEQGSNTNINKFLGNYTIDSVVEKKLSKEDKEWIAQCNFECYVMQARQRNAEYLMASRTWIKYLGFVTGMILCIVGSIFVLGKLNDKEPHAFNAGTGESKFGLQSHSPGIIIAGFGTLLIICTIFIHQNIEKTDAPVYFPTQKLFLQKQAIKAIIDTIPDSVGSKKHDKMGEKDTDPFITK